MVPGYEPIRWQEWAQRAGVARCPRCGRDVDFRDTVCEHYPDPLLDGADNIRAICRTHVKAG